MNRNIEYNRVKCGSIGKGKMARTESKNRIKT
jgi:hypothetical protein